MSLDMIVSVHLVKGLAMVVVIDYLDPDLDLCPLLLLLGYLPLQIQREWIMMTEEGSDITEVTVKADIAVRALLVSIKGVDPAVQERSGIMRPSLII